MNEQIKEYIAVTFEVTDAPILYAKSRGNAVMRKIPDLLGNIVSAKSGKTITDTLWQTGNGVSTYYLGGKIIAGCGIGWLLLSFIPIACKTPISDCIWMWIFAAVQIALGMLLVILSKKSKKFQIWANKDFQKGLKKKKKLEEKVKIGKVTLPITNGDILAVKICVPLIMIIVVLLGIGYLQGWAVW